LTVTVSEGDACFCPLPCNNGGTQNADCSCSCPNACEDETPNKDDCSCGLGQAISDNTSDVAVVAGLQRSALGIAGAAVVGYSN
jgi:hypothetical protein